MPVWPGMAESGVGRKGVVPGLEEAAKCFDNMSTLPIIKKFSLSLPQTINTFILFWGYFLTFFGEYFWTAFFEIPFWTKDV